MEKIGKIKRKILNLLEKEDRVREEGLRSLREITRETANIIRDIHKGDLEKSKIRIGEVVKKLNLIKKKLKKYPEIYYQGFLHQAEKEVIEAKATLNIIEKKEIPEIGNFDPISYLHGLCESLGEIRRYILDRMRENKFDGLEEYLKIMDEIYFFLLNFQYPDAITRTLRKQIDYARNIVEKTRGEITSAYLLRKKET
ncbi:MAG: hypothetical protein NC926_07315 [Candidatus Omnitrophica bacterium]|nr:hypothetical protein [Candidatus Omnitrophota bacterium]MCM8807732.1 hypothetical protein [Candidatus Omnitrophota bacterium]